MRVNDERAEFWWNRVDPRRTKNASIILDLLSDREKFRGFVRAVRRHNCRRVEDPSLNPAEDLDDALRALDEEE